MLIVVRVNVEQPWTLPGVSRVLVSADWVVGLCLFLMCLVTSVYFLVIYLASQMLLIGSKRRRVIRPLVSSCLFPCLLLVSYIPVSMRERRATQAISTNIDVMAVRPSCKKNTAIFTASLPAAYPPKIVESR